MNDQNIQSLVPTLRFSKFSQQWEKRKLKNVANINPKIGSLPERFNYIDLGSVKGTSLIKTDVFHRNNAPSRAQRLLENDDILYQTVRPYQKNNYLFNMDGKYVASTGYAQIRTAKTNPQFLFQFLYTERFVNSVLRMCTGTSYPAINTKDLKNTIIYTPSSEEQQKIASFLSYVDNWIEKLEKQRTSLEEYKKGMIQKIFSQEIRFKDENGNAYPEWQEQQLKNVFIRKTEKNKDNKINFVLTNSASEGIVSQSDYFDKDIANQNNLSNYYIVETDDFVYNPRISSNAPVGPMKMNSLQTGVMSPLYTVLKLKKGNKYFYAKYFETNLWHRYMKKIANYGARHDRMAISNSDLMNMPIPCPSEEEQKKIVNFVLSIDRLLDTKINQIKRAKEWKKGLLQQMFV